MLILISTADADDVYVINSCLIQMLGTSINCLLQLLSCSHWCLSSAFPHGEACGKHLLNDATQLILRL